MHLFWQYLREKRGCLALALLFSAIFALSFRLYHLPVGAAVYPALLCAVIALIALLRGFLRLRRQHAALCRIKCMADAAGSLPRREGVLDADYRRIIALLCEEHAAVRTQTDRKYGDMIDYYTVWAHQIKTPIASMRLHLQNEDSALARTLGYDLHRIEQYVEMVLAFLRLDSQSTDYLIREYDLDAIVRQAVRRFSSEFIGRRLKLVYAPLNARVITDEKWLCFVIEQLLSNALKYTPSGSVTIALEGERTLCIRDTGIGIAPEDLPRIFEKGFTGFNGRADKRASGIGLYLCRRICENLGHGISVQSAPDAGTCARIDLSQRRLEVE